MNVRINAPKLSDVSRRLKGIQNKAPFVISKSINDTILYLSKEIAHEVKKEYIVKIPAVKKTLSIKKARQSNLSGIVLSTSSKRVPLLGFKAEPAKRVFPSPPEFYTSKVLQSSSLKSLKGKGDRSKGFIATMKSGHTGIFQRIGREEKKRGLAGIFQRICRKSKNDKQQIRELEGPCIPSMFKNKKTVWQVQDKGQKYLKDRLDFHIKSVLGAMK